MERAERVTTALDAIPHFPIEDPIPILLNMMKQIHGAKFFRADLHTHTPASKDFRDRSASPQDVVHSAEQAGIEILGITDHNSANWVDDVTTAAANSPVTVIPGVEITTPEGHLLALFECGTTGKQIEDLLIGIEIERCDMGQEDAISKVHMEGVIERIHAAGGVAIAAHANEKTNGLLQRPKGQYRVGLVPNEKLAALEFTKQKDVEKFCAGSVPKYDPKACTHSSDAHSLVEIGRRFTYLKMQTPSLRGLRQALLDYAVKVRFPWDYETEEHPHIISLAVDQGFFGGEKFFFNEGLNCLVGGKGTGKSTVVELLRYCFDDVPEPKRIREDHESKVAALVGDGGTIVVEYADSDGITKTIQREVQSWDTERDVRDSSGNRVSIETPPALFSQGEIVLIASNPIAQLDLLDRRLDLSADNAEEAEAARLIRANSRQLGGHREKVNELSGEIEHPETGRDATRKQYQKIERQLHAPEVKGFPAWEAEQKRIQGLDETLALLPEQFAEAVKSVNISAVTITLPEESPNKDSLEPLEEIGAAIETAMTKVKDDFAAAAQSARDRVARVSNEIRGKYEARKAEHDRVLAGIGQATERKANAQYRSLGKRLAALSEHESKRDELTAGIIRLEGERELLRKRLLDARGSRRKKRLAKAKEYQDKLNGMVRIDVVAGGDRGEFTLKIVDLARGGRVKEEDIEKISSRLDPWTLLEVVQAEDATSLATKAEVSTSVAARLIGALRERSEEALYELCAVPLPDQPQLMYRVAGDREKPLNELSTGQKGTVITALAMIEGVGALVIDHPEEPLDTRSIYGQVVGALRDYLNHMTHPVDRASEFYSQEIMA